MRCTLCFFFFFCSAAPIESFSRGMRAFCTRVHACVRANLKEASTGYRRDICRDNRAWRYDPNGPRMTMHNLHSFRLGECAEDEKFYTKLGKRNKKFTKFIYFDKTSNIDTKFIVLIRSLYFYREIILKHSNFFWHPVSL